MYNHTTSSQLYYKYVQNLQRLHAKYAQSAKTTKLADADLNYSYGLNLCTKLYKGC